MDSKQAAALVDALIEQVDLGPSPLAVKFAPYLQDKTTGLTSPDEQLAVIKQNALDFVMKAHGVAIDRLREELKNDPTEVGYAGKNVEEIQTLLCTERPVFVEQTLALTEEELVNVAAAKIRGEAYEPHRETVEVQVAVQPHRIGVIWSGIPYARNLPSLDNINEALA